MKLHLGIAENCDGGPRFAGKAVLQKMIDGPADVFIIQGFRDASDAAARVKTQRSVLLKCFRADLPSSALVLHQQSRR